MISPRELYRKIHSEDAKQLAMLVHESWFQRAITYARADMAFANLDSTLHRGADIFLNALTQLSEEEPTAPELPDKSALSTYEPNWKPPEQKKKD